MIIDTHCHYNLEPLYLTPEDQTIRWQQHWQKAQQAGVSKSVVVGVNFFTSGTAVEMAQQEPNLFAAVGCHPTHYIDRIKEKVKQFPHLTIEMCVMDVQNDRNELSLIVDKKKVVAIGETGLDFYHIDDEPLPAEHRQLIMDNQRLAFKMQIQLAQEYNLPLIIHVRDKTDQAYLEVVETLRQAQFQNPFVLHCASGPLSAIQDALRMGAFLGMAGNITYKNADNIRQLIAAAPHEKLLLETDAPYLPPAEFRGQVCEPWMISKTAEFVHQQLGISLDLLTQNAETLFKI